MHLEQYRSKKKKRNFIEIYIKVLNIFSKISNSVTDGRNQYFINYEIIELRVT